MTIEQKALKTFGTTENFECAGYMLADGTMLNFSYDGMIRDEDHRIIGQFFKTAKGTDALNKMMARGNVRVMCHRDTYGFEIIKPPTLKQLQQIRRAMYIARRNGWWFYLECSDKQGRNTHDITIEELEQMCLN